MRPSALPGLCALALASGQAAGQAQPTRPDPAGAMMDVTLDFVRGNGVLGMEGDAVGEVAGLVRSADGEEGLYAVVRVKAGWADGTGMIVSHLSRFTITGDGRLRLDGLSEETVDDFAELDADDWQTVGEDHATFRDLYASLGWG